MDKQSDAPKFSIEDIAKEMLEVCVECVEGVRIAVDAGADRIEFSECLEVGGVTPSSDLLREAIHHSRRAESSGHAHGLLVTSLPVTAIPVIALIRCRPGDFYFNQAELRQMIDEIERAIETGCAGVAVGASLPGDDLNWAFMETVAKLHAARSGFELVLHRVFDKVPEPMLAIPRLIRLGYRRILTSGGAEHAIQSIEQLRQWQEAFGERIEILPAGGIGSSNAARILESTGCKQLHGSLRGISQRGARRLPDPDEIRKVQDAISAAGQSAPGMS